MLRIWFFLILGLFSFRNETWAQLSENAEISIITCRQGDQIYNTFGHTAILINDPILRKTELYNFGVFNFEEPGFTMKFLRGKLLYYLGINNYKGFMDAYTKEKRSVFTQKLDLNLEEKNKIYQALRENYKIENRKYLYDFFFDNCSTRARDLLENALPALTFPQSERKVSYRQLLDEYTFAKPWTDFGIDLIIGMKADKAASPRSQMFLPEYVYESLDKAMLNGKPLVEETELILNYENELKRRQKKSFLGPSLLFGLLLLLELFLFRKYTKGQSSKWIQRFDKLWFMAIGVGSMVILFMWFGTDHIATKSNLNILWMSPLFLFPALRKNKVGISILIGFLVLALIANIFWQQFHVASLMIIAISIMKLLRKFNRNIDLV